MPNLTDCPKTAVLLGFRGYLPSTLDINTTVSTWHESRFYIIIHRARASTLRKRTWILFFSRRGTCRPFYTVTGTYRETGSCCILLEAVSCKYLLMLAKCVFCSKKSPAPDKSVYRDDSPHISFRPGSVFYLRSIESPDARHRHRKSRTFRSQCTFHD